jgi:Uma2 family endonuclease
MHHFVTEKNLGEIFFASFDVFLDDKTNVVQPDILFISKENNKIIDEEGTVHGVPDLIIEILSPGNKTHDTVKKKELYEKFGVKEYWIVDPETKKSIGYSLDAENHYQVITEASGSVESLLLGETFTF